MIKLDGLHLLITYQCTFECDHCFVWGSPFQTGTMTINTIRKIILQAKATDSVKWIYFEGGEPFIYYQTMLAGIHLAHDNGFNVGIVSNSYWATSEEDARLWLSPLVGLVQDFTISSDLFHFNEKVSQQSKFVTTVAQQLGIPLGMICIEQPELDAVSSVGQIPQESSSIMFRGRAAEKLINKVPHHPASQYTRCPHENLVDPGRVHIDPLGNVHTCQGISIGNIFSTTINQICEEYEATNHAIISALLDGGPYELARRFQIPTEEKYADACHLCYETRKVLRNTYPEILIPDQMYGVKF